MGVLERPESVFEGSRLGKVSWKFTKEAMDGHLFLREAGLQEITHERIAYVLCLPLKYSI